MALAGCEGVGFAPSIPSCHTGALQLLPSNCRNIASDCRERFQTSYFAQHYAVALNTDFLHC